MNRFVGMVGAVALMAIGGANITAAQSDGAIAGWSGLTLTPVGALTPVAPTESGGILARYSRWRFGPGDDETTNLGVGFRFSAGRNQMMVTGGFGRVEECGGDCNTLFLGLDLTVPTRPATPGGMGVAVNTSLGFMKPIDDEGNALSIALNVPLSFVLPLGSQSTLIPFFIPGVGLGRISAGGDSEIGWRAMIGGGVTLAGLGPLELTASFRRIFIDDGPTVYGVGVGFGK